MILAELPESIIDVIGRVDYTASSESAATEFQLVASTDYDNLSDKIRQKGDKMKVNLIKLFVLASILVLAVIVIGGINTTSADVLAQGKPPTVALPTRVGTKPPTLTATPTKPGAQPQVGNTPVAPLKGATVTRTPTRGVKGPRLAFSSYTSGFQVQNLSGSTANITLTYYNQDGTVNTAPNDTIPANGSKTYYPIHPSGSFNGSVVVSSDQPVASVVNVLGSSATTNAGASYVGATQGGISVSLPLLMKNHGAGNYSTWFNVQNTSSTDATVNVNYSDGTTAGPYTIRPGAARTFDQSTEVHNATVFSAIVTSSQPVTVVVIQENPSVMLAYSGFTGGTTNPVMPLVNANNSGYVTGIQIQNIGSSATDVTVSYTPASAGTACTETQNIPAGQSRTFALAAFANGANSNCAPGARFVGSARVTGNSANQNLVAIVNQLKAGVNGEAYGGFDPARATNKVVLPLIMDRNNNWYTGFNVMNVGTTSTTVICTFSGTSYTINTGSLAPGQAYNAIQNGQIAPGYVGSATCIAANSSDKIVAVVNEVNNVATGDRLLVYEGINQ